MSDKIVHSHLNYMLGAAQADLVRGDMVMDEIAIDRRISHAVAAIRSAVDDADAVLYGLKALGIPAHKPLGAALDTILQAAEDIGKCQSEAVTCRFRAAEQSTANMMNAVLATVGTLSSEAE